MTAVALVLVAVGLGRRTRWILFVGALVAVAAVAAYDTHLGALSFATDNADTSLQYRYGTRAAAIPVVLGSAFGAGVAQAPNVLYDALYAVFFGKNYVGSTAHDLFLNWGIDLGWVGLLLLIVALYIAFRRGATAGGWPAVLPLAGFLVVGSSAGMEILTESTQWSTTMFVLIALVWRRSDQPLRGLEVEPDVGRERDV